MRHRKRFVSSDLGVRLRPADCLLEEWMLDFGRINEVRLQCATGSQNWKTQTKFVILAEMWFIASINLGAYFERFS
jgi:hypothetical protein